jgi:CubicO group peptidase (beta-lactamase class C family)
MGSDGEYNLGGAAGTVFWIEPVEELVVISMIQLMQSPWPLRSDVKVAVYQALSETYEK